MLELFKSTKLIAKKIGVTRVLGLYRTSAQMTKARSALRKNDLVKVKEHVTAGVEYYHILRKTFRDF